MSLTKTYFNALEDPFDFIPKEVSYTYTSEDLKWAIEVATRMNGKLENESKSMYFTRLKADAFLFLETFKDLRNDSRHLD